MSTARYFAILAAVFAALLALAAADAWVQIGMPTRNGLYTCAYIHAKIARGLVVPSPKLVIVSGSNALAGIDTQALGKALSVRAFNFGLAASFGPGFQSFEAAKILKPGDAALLPFEYLAYDYEKPRDSLVDAVYTCGTDYLRSLPLQEKLFFVLAARPQRIVDSALFLARPRASADIIALAAADVGPFGQRPQGDFPAHAVAIEAGSANQPLAIHMDDRSPGAAAIAGFVAWAHAHRVVVLATWPNTLDLPQYRGSPAFARIRDFYRSLGVDVVGTPEDAMLPASLMGDTVYHPNRTGMAIRTARLVAALREDRVFQGWAGGARVTPP